LAELALGLQRTKLLGDIVTMICQRSRALLEVDGAFLWLGSDTLSGSAGDAAPGIDVQGILSTAPTMINLRALRHMGHNAIDDVRTSPHAAHPLLQRLQSGSALVVPLIGKHMPVGVMVLTDMQRIGRFGDAIQARAKLLAAEAAAAVESALLIERIGEET